MAGLIKKYLVTFALILTSTTQAQEPTAHPQNTIEWISPESIFSTVGTFLTMNPQTIIQHKKIDALWVYDDILFGKTPVHNALSTFALGIEPQSVQIGCSGPKNQPVVLFKYDQNTSPPLIFTALLNDFLNTRASVPNSANAVDPKLGVNPQGDAVVAFEQTGQIFATNFDHLSGTWLNPTALSEANSSRPRVALSKTQAAVAWLQSKSKNHIVVAVEDLNSANDFSKVAKIPVCSDPIDSINLIWTNRGKTLAVFWEQCGVVYAANSDSCPAWKPVPLIRHVTPDSLQVACSTKKQKIVLLWKSIHNECHLGINTALLTIDQPKKCPCESSSSDHSSGSNDHRTNFHFVKKASVPNSAGAYAINLAVSGQGNAVVVYLQDNASGKRRGGVYASYTNKFNKWSKPVKLAKPSSTEPGVFTSAAINEAGNLASALWITGNTVTFSKGIIGIPVL